MLKSNLSHSIEPPAMGGKTIPLRESIGATTPLTCPSDVGMLINASQPQKLGCEPYDACPPFHLDCCPLILNWPLVLRLRPHCPARALAMASRIVLFCRHGKGK